MSGKKGKNEPGNGLESGLKRPGESPGIPKKDALAALGGPGAGPRLPSGRPKTHGGFSFLSTGRLPENRREIQRYLTQVREGLVNDFGPLEADLNTSQLLLINSITTSTGFLRLVEEYCKDAGALGPDGELRHCLSAFYLSMLNSQRLNILALKNVQRAERPAPILAEYIQAADAAKIEKDKATASNPQAIAPLRASGAILGGQDGSPELEKGGLGDEGQGKGKDESADDELPGAIVEPKNRSADLQDGAKVDE